MVIFPKIEIQNSKLVQLRLGKLSDPVVYDMTPLQASQKFVAEGAKWLHIVDLDGVAQGGRHNAEVICQIIDSVQIPVQVGGGIRTMASLQWWMEHGATRAVLGTASVNDPHFLHEACGHYPGKIIISIDARNDNVVIEGWTKPTSYTPVELGKSLQTVGAAAIIYTDIGSAHDLPEASFAATTQMAASLDIPVISSGVVRSLDDISTLTNLPNISGLVLGRALYEGKILLKHAVAIASTKPTQAAFI